MISSKNMRIVPEGRLTFDCSSMNPDELKQALAEFCLQAVERFDKAVITDITPNDYDGIRLDARESA